MLLYLSRLRHAPVAQLDRVTDYESVGRGFESLLAYQWFLSLRICCGLWRQNKAPPDIGRCFVSLNRGSVVIPRPQNPVNIAVKITGVQPGGKLVRPQRGAAFLTIFVTFVGKYAINVFRKISGTYELFQFPVWHIPVHPGHFRRVFPRNFRFQGNGAEFFSSDYVRALAKSELEKTSSSS